jgi:hypothetical protein
METKKQYVWGGLALVVVLVILGVWQAKRQDATVEQPTGGQNVSGQTPEAPATTTPETAAGQTPAKKLSYGEAIKKYQYRIQFVNCSGNPGMISVKRNIAIMLDNRDNKKHTIKVAGKTYTIAALDYALAYIPTEGTHNLTCDGGGSATVNIEK